MIDLTVVRKAFRKALLPTQAFGVSLAIVGPSQVIRSTGVFDDLVVGDIVTLSSFTHSANNGDFTVADVSGDTLTFNETTLVDETAGTRVLAVNYLIESIPLQARWNWEGEEFEPPEPKDATTFWVREQLSITNEPVTAIGDLTRAEGIYTLDVYVPKGTGTETVESIAKTLLERAPHALLESGTEISIFERRRSSLSEVGTRYFKDIWENMPVRYFWRAFVSSNLGG